MDEIEKLSINISPFSQPAEYRLYLNIALKPIHGKERKLSEH